ncbi:30S ribosomal protein S9 [candidate division KSB1 bacterium]
MDEFRALGRRKTSVARVILRPGKGVYKVNKRDLNVYFPFETIQILINKPFKVTETENKFDVFVNVRGGGISGQAGAIQLGIARALLKYEEKLKDELKAYKLLTRDPRMVERKKYGQKKARKRFQFSKR